MFKCIVREGEREWGSGGERIRRGLPFSGKYGANHDVEEGEVRADAEEDVEDQIKNIFFASLLHVLPCIPHKDCLKFPEKLVDSVCF